MYFNYFIWNLRQQDIFSFPIKQEIFVGKLFKEMCSRVNDFTNYFIKCLINFLFYHSFTALNSIENYCYVTQ